MVKIKSNLCNYLFSIISKYIYCGKYFAIITQLSLKELLHQNYDLLRVKSILYSTRKQKRLKRKD